MDKTHYRLSKIDASAIYGQFVKTSTEWRIIASNSTTKIFFKDNSTLKVIVFVHKNVYIFLLRVVKLVASGFVSFVGYL